MTPKRGWQVNLCTGAAGHNARLRWLLTPCVLNLVADVRGYACPRMSRRALACGWRQPHRSVIFLHVHEPPA